MENKGFGDYQARLAAIRERYRASAIELAALRNHFFAEFPMARHIGDAQWVEIYWLIHELWETSPQQEVQNAAKSPGSAVAVPPPDFTEEASMLCAVCGFPLTGRQRLYCGETCKKKSARKQAKRAATHL